MQSRSETHDIIIIGGGPAGMFAAIQASKILGPEAQILLLDGNIKLGRKLGVTGNGRCNLTNAEMSADHFHGKNPRFVNGLLAKFSNYDLLAYFNSLGVEFKEEEKGRYIPVTDQAITIIDNLKEELSNHHIEVRTQVQVLDGSGKFGQFVLRDGQSATFHSKAILIATGGLTYPQLGANADGYRLAEKFGHKIVEPVPSLVGFDTHEKSLFDLQGVQLFARVSVRSNGKIVQSADDEILFTHYGISGPALFSLSATVSRELKDHPVSAWLDFFPDLSEEDLDRKILAIWEANPTRNLGNSLIGILPKKHVQVLLRNVLKLDIESQVSRIPKAVRLNIVRLLKNLEVRLKAPRSFKEAQVTDGGVDTDDVDSRTMESKLCAGLFFAGEVLDIHGDCGGYNLQFAFSSGALAGKSAAEKVRGLKA